MEHLKVDTLAPATEGLLDAFRGKGTEPVINPIRDMSKHRYVGLTAGDVDKIYHAIQSGNFKVRDPKDMFYIHDSESIFPSKDTAGAYEAAKNFADHFQAVQKMTILGQDAFAKVVPALRDCAEQMRAHGKDVDFVAIAVKNWNVLQHTVAEAMNGKEVFLGDPVFAYSSILAGVQPVLQLEKRYRINKNDTLFSPMTAEQCKEMISKYNSAISGLSRVHRVVTGNGFLTKFDDVAPARNRSYLNPVNGGKARVLWGYLKEHAVLQTLSSTVHRAPYAFHALLKGSIEI